MWFQTKSWWKSFPTQVGRSHPRASDIAEATTSRIYVANSPLVAEIAFTNNGVEIMRTVKSYDMLNRLTNIVSTTNGVALSKFAYLYNGANQRTRATMVDGSYWLWGYDSLGQVTGAKRYWSDNSPVAGQQFEYAFDTIGNRITTQTGGDLYGANLRQADYGANFLNQYTNRSIPGSVDVQGSAHSNATVSVWGDNGSWSPTVRKGEYFRGELAVTNSAAAVWLGFTNIAVLNTATNDIITNILGHTFVPQTPEAFTHDLDGNLTGDGKWTYTWDAENRLIAMESVTSVPNATRKKLEFGYDSRWRRTSRIVSTNLNGTFYPAYTNYFVYDGWNLIAVLGPQSTVPRSFIWGLDLSGSLQGAGGVGGLLAVADSSLGSHFTSFDGNGNLTSLLNASTRTESARTEFGPFGEVLRATGPMAMANPFRFSTKFQDDETGLLYYGYRYYDPSTGRWNSRDPIAEAGGANLLGMVLNDPASSVDLNGLRGKVIILVPRIHPGAQPDNGAECRMREGAKRHLQHGDTVFSVDSVEDANERMRNLSCCIKELQINGHGRPGFQRIGSDMAPQQPSSGYRSLGVEEDGNGGYKEWGFELFDGIKFCKPCVIWLRGCNTANHDKGLAFIKKIAEKTGCTVHGFNIQPVFSEETWQYEAPGNWFERWGGTERADPPIPIWCFAQ